jgi:hypothetical protein
VANTINLRVGDTDHVEVWYELEYSSPGADDWFSSNDKADTSHSIAEKLVMLQRSNKSVEWRAVRKILTTDVLEITSTDNPEVRHASCENCGQDIEGYLPYHWGSDWRDRGNNSHCADGKKHKPTPEGRKMEVS